MQNSISEHIKDLALKVGFDACGLAKATLLSQEMNVYKQWLANAYAAEMHYAHNHLPIREDINHLHENTKTVLVTLTNYYPERLQGSNFPQIAKYAYGRDYHKVLLKMQQTLLEEINKKVVCKGRIFVDSAPVMERTWAYRAGLGFIGKSGMLISPKIGVHTLISGIALDVEMDVYDKPIKRSCGRCSLCIDNCPVKAIVEPGVIDSRKCLSYLTIEHRGNFEPDTKLHNRIFGCDGCIDVCPYNKARVLKLKDFTPQFERLTISKDDWNSINEEQFNHLFNGTPVKRAKLEGIKRNLGAL